MGGRGARYDAAKTIIGQYSLSDITGSKGKIINFFRNQDQSKGIRIEDGRIKVTKEAMTEARELADDLSQHISERDPQMERDFRDIRRQLSEPHYMSEADRRDIADFSTYARSGENFVRISNRGAAQSIDQLYENLADQYPHYFQRDATLTPSDRLLEINRVMESLKNSSVSLPEYLRKEAADELRLSIIRHYVSVSNRKRSA